MIEVKHIKIAIKLYLFSLFDEFFKKLIPNEIAVVKIEINIVIPYIFFAFGYIILIAYTAGICNSFIFTSILTKNRKIINSSVIVIIVTIKAIYFIFLLFFI